MDEDKKYNAIDFERYHTGMMSPDEMHALEKAALADPFLADALDGYAYSIDTQKELSEIKDRLAENSKRPRLSRISTLASSTWWQIAAVFLVIAGVGYFLFQKSNRSYKASLAINETSAKQESKTEDSTIIMNGSDLQETTATKPDAIVEKISPGASDATGPKKMVAANSKIKKETLDESSIQKESNINLQMAPTRNNELLAGKLPGSTDTSQVVASFSAEDSPVLAYAQRSFADTSHNVAMNKKPASADEVIITGYGTTQKAINNKNRPAQQLEGKVSGVQIQSTPYLRDGEEKFKEYIKEHATTFPDSVNILLSFTLNNVRKPSRIKVISSTCKSCEKEAIRLLKSGPVWVGKPGAKGTVRIQLK